MRLRLATECYNPDWEVHENQNSVGASQYSAAKSVQECLDYCGSQSNCVAADVDLTRQPPTCWPHLSANAFLRSNVFSQPGTNQYRLKTRCVNDTAGILAISGFTPLRFLGSGCRIHPLLFLQQWTVFKFRREL